MTKFLFSLMLIIVIETIPQSLFPRNKADLDTSLIGAVKRNNLALAKKLISKGADVNFQGIANVTILMWAGQLRT